MSLATFKNGHFSFSNSLQVLFITLMLLEISCKGLLWQVKLDWIGFYLQRNNFFCNFFILSFYTFHFYLSRVKVQSFRFVFNLESGLWPVDVSRSTFLFRLIDNNRNAIKWCVYTGCFSSLNLDKFFKYFFVL